MSARDRSVITLVLLLVLAVGGYFIVVAPEHHKATALTAQISGEQGALSQAEARLNAGEAAEAKYLSYVRQMKLISAAVPGDAQVPGLINELQTAASRNRVGFETVSLGGGSAASTTSTSATGVGTGTFPSQSFTLSFTGNYYAVANLLGTLDSFVRADDRDFSACGRLLSISSVSLTPRSSTGSAATGAVSASVTASDYDVPTALLSGAPSSATAG